MYRAPVRDLRFVLDELLGVASLAALPRYREFSGELAASVIEEAARFSQDVLGPINRLGDEVGASFRDGAIQMPQPFRDAYRQYIEGGWTQLTAAPEFGGQGAPLTLAVAVEEIGFGANVSFMLCPLLSRGAAEALEVTASAPLQALLLPKLVSGEWTGTMNLTEPQAGSDLAAIRTHATPEGEHYRISGQKIFITYGEHDLTPNIVHLVLARIDGAVAGIKGISLFAVPKFLINADGSLGPRNDVRCAAIEHKLGIHASPTCAMSYGDGGGALGYLIGKPHHGLEYMFIMMNSARLSVGVQGIGLAELALQQAGDWARNRVQGRPVAGGAGGAGSAGGAGGAGAGAGGSGGAAAALTIGHHPDVRRMLLTIRANVEAMRALALYTALQLDRARAETDDAIRRAAHHLDLRGHHGDPGQRPARPQARARSRRRDDRAAERHDARIERHARQRAHHSQRTQRQHRGADDAARCDRGAAAAGGGGAGARLCGVGAVPAAVRPGAWGGDDGAQRRNRGRETRRRWRR